MAGVITQAKTELISKEANAQIKTAKQMYLGLSLG